MGAIGGLLGTAGGANGTGFSGPSSANIINPASQAQADTQYTNAQNALQQQNAFLQATQAQNGLQNQSNVFNQMQGVANGTGPNPAQAQLAQATGANVANQSAMMAGQRGAGANVGLMARQAAQQGAATQQQSAGQAATMQAQQSLGALQNLGNIAGQQVGQQAAATGANTQATQGEQQNILNAISAQNNANVGMSSNINNVNGQLANTTMQGQQAMLGGLMPSAGSIMGMLAKGGVVRHYDEGGGVDPNSSPHVDPTPTFGSDSGASALGGKSSSGGGGGGALALLARGGQPRPMYAQGQYIQAPPMSNDQWNAMSAGMTASNPVMPATPVAQAPQASQGPKSSFTNFLKGNKPPSANPAQSSMNYGNSGANALAAGMQQGMSNLFKPSKDSTEDENTNQEYLKANSQLGTADPNNIMKGDKGFNKETDMSSSNDAPTSAAKGGKVPAMVSPGERYLKPQDVEKVSNGANPMKVGEVIPGKPKVGGAKNSYSNDTVPRNLPVGGIVLPRSVTQSKNPEWAAHKFVRAVMANKGGKI